MKINLNGPDGDVFQLAGKIMNLMQQAGLDIKEFNHNVFKHKDYHAFVENCKEQCKKITEITGEPIEIFSSEEYQMEV